jgi:Ca2+-binding RTX toxin-like protein
MAEIVGTSGNDVRNGDLNWAGEADIIQGLEGDDTLSGLGGDDIIEGGAGRDTLDGGEGADILNGDVGDDTLIGGAGADEITMGTGVDTVTAGDDGDVIFVGANLTAADSIDGGAGFDILHISGIYASPVIFTANTVRDVERFEIGVGQVKLTLAATTNVSVVNAAVQGQTDSLVLNAAAATNAMTVDGGAGDDTITAGSGADDLFGGQGRDVLVGGAGNDLIEGGLDGDTLTGGAGIDVFRFGYNSPRSDSSPSTIDVITDFEGAGVVGGDKLDLPGYAYGRGLVFNAGQINFTFSGTEVSSGVQLPTELVGDGFADVSWKRDTANNRVEVWVDVDDDGQFSELDLYFYLNGATGLSTEDFADGFPVWRGTLGADNLAAAAGKIVAYGLAGNDTLRAEQATTCSTVVLAMTRFVGVTTRTRWRARRGDDLLFGDNGDDTLRGGDGNDQLDGGAGYDNIYGGAGTTG